MSELQTDIVKAMTAQGWTIEVLPAMPDIVGRFFKRSGEVELNIERCVDGFCVALYRYARSSSVPDLIEGKDHCAMFIQALFKANVLQEKYGLV